MSTANLPHSSQRKLKILLVRSKDGECTGTEDRLTVAGHLVLSTIGGHDAARALRNRPVNLVLIEGFSASNVLDVVAGLRGDNGRLSTRYTPIFVLSHASSFSPKLPSHVDGVLALPLDCDVLVAAYLEFLSTSLGVLKRAGVNVACCDVDAAIDRLGGDVELYKDLVGRFLDDTAGTRHQLEAAHARRDGNMLHRAAHNLKGLAASVGAVSVAAVLGELEALGRAEEFDNLASVWQRLMGETEKTAHELALYHRTQQFSSLTSR